MQGYSIIAQCLTTLLKKGKFQWTEKTKNACENLKHAMITTPTLAMSNFKEPFTIETDASGEGIGVVRSAR